MSKVRQIASIRVDQRFEELTTDKSLINRIE